MVPSWYIYIYIYIIYIYIYIERERERERKKEREREMVNLANPTRWEKIRGKVNKPKHRQWIQKWYFPFIFSLSLSLSLSHTHTHTHTYTYSHTHTHIYIYIYIYMCVWNIEKHFYDYIRCMQILQFVSWMMFLAYKPLSVK